MDYEELLREYIKLFVLVMETMGQATNNKKYMDVGKCIEDNEPNIKELIEWEPDFHQAIGYLIVSLLLTIHDKSDIVGWENHDRINYFIDDLYTRNLEKVTNAFLRKNGMPILEKPSQYGTVTLFEKFRR